MRKSALGFGLAALIVVLTHAAAFAADGSFEATYRSAKEGDIVVIDRAGTEMTVHVWGVACPHKKQPYAKKARNFTQNMLYKRTFVVKPVATAEDGLPWVEIVLNEGPNVGQELARKGLAWANPQHADPAIKTLESEARAAKEGLWSQGKPVPPWEYQGIGGKTK
ncbi:MAG: thermonuclease family protein [Deltaproteobacteria bacterium]|nr:thermonuclease family protein [Deltaproteobacteria bacterium]